MTEKHLPTDSALVDAFRNGTLGNLVFSDFGYLDSGQLDELIGLCADLHNTGAIDLLSLTRPDRLATVEPTTFFTGQHFFCRVIPLLAGPAEDVMTAVTALADKGGQDLAANQPHAAFRDWCAVDVARSCDIIERAYAGDSLATKLVTFALEAWHLADEAMALLDNPSDEIRLSAVTALGRMTHEGQEAARVALQNLDGTLDNPGDEQFVSNVLVAALSITSRSEAVPQEALEIVRRVAALGGATITQSCAYALWAHGKALPEEVVDLLLETLSATDPHDEAVIRQLDNALQALLGSEHHDRAIDFVRRFLATADGRLAGTHFEHFGSQFKREPKDRLWGTLVAWLVSGERAPCEWAFSLIEKGTGDEPTELPASALQVTGTDKIFLARKVIGYLFLKPVCCASILVSVLRTCDDQVAQEVGELLFDPMLINYGGTIREYLEALPAKDPAYSYVQKALKKTDGFLAELLPLDAIRELHPSDHKRQIAHQLTSDQMSAAMKHAQADSVLLSLVRHSVVLYGRRSLAYFAAPDQPRRAVEMNLQPHSVSFEMPRLQKLDPVGLEYLLRVFRAEEPTP